MKNEIDKSVDSYNRKVQDLKGDTRRAGQFSLEQIVKLIKVVLVVMIPAALAGSLGGEAAFVVVFLIMMFAYGGIRVGRILGYVPEKEGKTAEEELVDSVLEEAFNEEIIQAVTAPVEPVASLDEFMKAEEPKENAVDFSDRSFVADRVVRTGCEEKLHLADSGTLFEKRGVDSVIEGRVGAKNLSIGTVKYHNTRSMFDSDTAHFVCFIPGGTAGISEVSLVPDNSRRYVGNGINALFKRKNSSGPLQTVGSVPFQKLFRLYCGSKSDALFFLEKYEKKVLDVRQKLGDSLYLSLNDTGTWIFWKSDSYMNIVPEFDGKEIDQSEVTGAREALVAAVNDVYDLIAAL